MHTIEAVVDRLVIHEPQSDRGARRRSTPTGPVWPTRLETALKLGKGMVMISIIGGEEYVFSEHFACPNCGISMGAIEPRTFSFNSPHGACPVCTGLGTANGTRPRPHNPRQEPEHHRGRRGSLGQVVPERR